MIYLDHNATTPLDPRVKAAMDPLLTEIWGNPSSVHTAGRKARRLVEEAREHVAALVAAEEPEEIVFTSGGTEADALALSTVRTSARRAVAVSAVEHAAVAEPARALEREGVERRVLPALGSGALDLEASLARIDDRVAVVSVMAANNEYGAILPIEAVAKRAHERGALFHTDAVAALGKIAVGVSSGADMISLSAHKIGGPKGVGALFVRRGLDVPPLFGGGQERRRRGGTENAAGIVGFGEAAWLCSKEHSAGRETVRRLRDDFERAVRAEWPAARIWGESVPRIGNTSAIAFPGRAGEAIAIALDLEGIAVSVGSACSSGSVVPSPAILALGASPEEARSTVRFSFGEGNSPDDVEAVVSALRRILSGNRP
ncbi:MAG TPA: cysteine desulfurase family protein [Thermoanaerobaculia bacterium]|nr:cysteine desulfurase family protein [Thermoanaerobaculia bacterium]